MAERRAVNQKIDKDMDKWLKDIQNERVKRGVDDEKISVRKITRKMLKLPSFKTVEVDLLNKRGAITDIFVWIIVGLVFILFIGTWIYAHNVLTTELLSIANPSDINVNITKAVEDTFGEVNSGLNVFKWSVGAIILVLGFSILISNFLVRVNPVFIIPYIFIVVVAVIFSVFVSNAYELLIRNNATIGATIQSIAGADYIYLFLPVWTTIIGILGGMMMFLGIIRDRGAGESII